MFRIISQTRIHYADSPLSEGKAGEVEGRDRLPWVHTAGLNNFAFLRSLDWQVHVYGETQDAFGIACGEIALPLHTFAWNDAVADTGLKRDAAYMIRPDGHVALALPEQSPTKLKRYVDRLGLRFPKSRQAT